MSDTIELVRAVLAEHCPDEAAARDLLDAALALEIDPLDFFACRFGLGHAIVLERAAHWAGYAFWPRPIRGPLLDTWPRLDAIGTSHVMRGRLFDREVVYLTPTFWNVLRLKTAGPQFRRSVCIVPGAAMRSELNRQLAQSLLDEARQKLLRRWPLASAALDLPLIARLGFVGGLTAIVLATMAAGIGLTPWITLPVDLFLVTPALFRLYAALTEFRRRRAAAPARLLEDAELPVYSVLVPLRDEEAMVSQLYAAIAALDYPAEKLDVKFVVEARSVDTIAAIRRLPTDPRFELIEVPDGPPRTKPKALVYALPFVRGENVVVYDAEDIPDPGQLRMAASLFAADPGLDCLQAELTIDNRAENWLTAMFAGEYAGLFGLMLPALARCRLPMPLGGTSNHFRSAALREVGAWDAFNVTEDADLGVRMARLRYRVASLCSETGEEAPITVSAWLAQRTRWMKGWMQTFLVHNRHPVQFRRDIGWRGFLAFELYVGGMILSAPLHTVFLTSVLLRPIFWPDAVSPPALTILNDLVIVIGYGGTVVLVVMGLLRLGEARLLPAQLGLPIYWLLHSVASVRATAELLSRPYFWAKTTHGRTRLQRVLRHRFRNARSEDDPKRAGSGPDAGVASS